MTYDIRSEGAYSVISLRGDVDLDSSPKVRDALLSCVGSNQQIYVDLSEVAYIDSSGVASLVEAYQSARKTNRTFALVSVSESAMRVLELSRLDRVFAIHPSLEDALKDGI